MALCQEGLCLPSKLAALKWLSVVQVGLTGLHRRPAIRWRSPQWCQELADHGDRLLPQPRHVLSVAVIEKRAVGMWSIVFRRFEALGKKCRRTADLLVTGDPTVGSVLPCLP